MKKNEDNVPARGYLRVFMCVKTMSGPTEIVGTFRRAVITGLSRMPEWSELDTKLTFVRFCRKTDKTTQEKKYVVFAHAHPPLRKAAWMKLFLGAKTIEKVSEFEECELYCRAKERGLLGTLGKPLRKDVVRIDEQTKQNNVDRKRQHEEAEQQAEKQAEEQRLDKRQKIKADDEAKYANALTWVDWPEDREFECASLMTKLFEKSVDWRFEPEWLQFLALMDISELVMLVDNVNEEPNHQILARAKRPQTLSWWNKCFENARMTVQDALPPTDLEAFYNEQRQAFPKDEFFLYRLCKREQIKREHTNESKSNESKSCL